MPSPERWWSPLNTVKKHAGHVLAKLGAANRTEAIAGARQLGLIPERRLSDTATADRADHQRGAPGGAANRNREGATQAARRRAPSASRQAAIQGRAGSYLLGTPIGELRKLDPLAVACAADRRWSFLLAAAPLSVVGGVGSPANAIGLR